MNLCYNIVELWCELVKIDVHLYAKFGGIGYNNLQFRLQPCAHLFTLEVQSSDPRAGVIFPGADFSQLRLMLVTMVRGRRADIQGDTRGRRGLIPVPLAGLACVWKKYITRSLSREKNYLEISWPIST